MTSDSTFTVDLDASPEVVAALDEHLTVFNAEATGSAPAEPLCVAARDAEGELVGGLSGETRWGWLHVLIVWVGAAHRGRGVGAQLMARAEDEARRRGCHGVSLNTFTWQAPGFYERLGYREFGRLEDYPEGVTLFFFRKDLAPAGDAR